MEKTIKGLVTMEAEPVSGLIVFLVDGVVIRKIFHDLVGQQVELTIKTLEGKDGESNDSNG